MTVDALGRDGSTGSPLVGAGSLVRPGGTGRVRARLLTLALAAVVLVGLPLGPPAGAAVTGPPAVGGLVLSAGSPDPDQPAVPDDPAAPAPAPLSPPDAPEAEQDGAVTPTVPPEERAPVPAPGATDPATPTTPAPGPGDGPGAPAEPTAPGVATDGTVAPEEVPAPDGGATAEPGAPGTADPTVPVPDDQPALRPATAPAVAQTTIPLGSIALSVVVLLAGVLLLRALLRRRPDDAGGVLVPAAAVDDRAAGSGPAGPVGPVGPVGAGDQDGVDEATLDLLVALGTALIDAGDATHHVQETLQEVAAANGAPDVGIVVMPTALFVSVPHADGVRTEVTPAGVDPLRLAQVEEVYRVLGDLRRGVLTPTAAVVALARARTAPPPYGLATQLVGYVLFTLGLVLILRGGWAELALGAVVGLLVGALQLVTERLRPHLQPLLPVGAALAASVVVLTTARLVPELSVFPPLVASLVAFLPGALLTTAVFELSTGHIMSGAGRLAAGGLRLVLLALGILAGAALVGVPAATVAGVPSGAVSVLAPWLGVVVFAVGVVLFRGASRSSLPWILLVVLVSYAGQVVGGALLGPSLSAFAGALAMTPAAMIVARQPDGPPAIVSFLPGFWLLVPGAVGLEGVTRFLDEETLEGVSSLVTMGTSMVGIALGVLLGLAAGTEVVSRLRGVRSRPEDELVAQGG